MKYESPGDAMPHGVDRRYTVRMTRANLSDSPAQPKQELSLLDTTSIIVGIIIGSAIYEISPVVARGASGWAARAVGWWIAGGAPPSDAQIGLLSTAMVIGLWIVGGVVALIGALCYAELATAYPQAGGTYVFLSESLGRSVGLAFAWAEFWIVRPGNVGAVAFVLARYGAQFLPLNLRALPQVNVYLAVAAIVALAVINAVGLQAGKWTQNVLTACKLGGLAAIVLTAMSVSQPAAIAAAARDDSTSLSLGLILIMFAYGGWADMSFVAAEVRQPERNIFRALLLGTGVVIAIYVAVNLAFLYALGVGGLARAKAVAAEVLALRLGERGSQVISLLVVISCLGGINGMLFTGARVYYALGTQHSIFRWLGAWNEATGVPLRSLVLQTAVTVGLVIGFGLSPDGFERLVVFTGPFYWGFIGLVGVALIILRLRGANAGTFRVPLYPLTPLLFAASSAVMVYAAVDYIVRTARDKWVSDPWWAIGGWWALAVIVTGLIVGIADWRSRRR